MGQHKTNQVALAAATGEIDPKFKPAPTLTRVGAWRKADAFFAMRRQLINDKAEVRQKAKQAQK